VEEIRTFGWRFMASNWVWSIADGSGQQKCVLSGIDGLLLGIPGTPSGRDIAWMVWQAARTPKDYRKLGVLSSEPIEGDPEIPQEEGNSTNEDLWDRFK
jgi:hypothetical protein